MKLTEGMKEDLGNREYWDKERKGSYWIVTTRQEWDSETCEEIIKLILTNHEDAQIFNGLIKAGYDMTKIGRNEIIVERLKKLIEDFKQRKVSANVIYLLQEILVEENEEADIGNFP